MTAFVPDQDGNVTEVYVDGRKTAPITGVVTRTVVVAEPAVAPDLTLISTPPHYIAGRKYEPWDVIRDWRLNFFLGAVVKYVSRAGRKPGSSRLDDLYKALAFLQEEIDAEEKGR